jgi:RHS repeat-associated protein
VRSIADQRWGRTAYEYDNLDQLIEAKRGSLSEVFDYDAIGSLHGVLTRLSERETHIPWDVGTGNVLYATKTADFTNDKNHRRRTMKDRKTGNVTEYLWDCRDRLREVRFPDGRRALYTYDAFGRRVRKEIVPKVVVADLAAGRTPEVKVTEFLWDGNALAAELSTEHGARVHVHAPGTLVPMLQAEQGEVFAVVCDHLGMPKELLGQDGRVAWAAAHSAWGRVVEVKRSGGETSEKGGRPIESPFRLLGQYADDETGLCYTRFRYFEAGTGRWLSPDPLGIEGGENLFGWDGDPVNEVDPLGLARDKCGDGNVRIRHYTNAKGLKGIQESGVIRAKDQNKVFAEPAQGKPLSPRDAEEKYQIQRGHGTNIIETDVPAERVNRVYNSRIQDYELQIQGDVTLMNPTFKKR